MALQRKGMECLSVAALPIGSAERWERLQQIAATWSWRAVEKKITELVARGYIEPLRGGTACGDLTEKGRQALAP